MKKSHPAFLEAMLKKLQPHGPIHSRAMFGGYGIYYEGVIFAAIVEDRLYFRVDDFNRKEFETHHAEPFVFEGGRGRPAIMPYLTLPEVILNNPQELPLWIQKAYQASLRHRKPKKSKKPIRSLASARSI